MKIGAGGLQAQVVQDAARITDASRSKPTVEQVLLQSEDLALSKMRYELNKAVERMRQAAEMFNQPLDFLVKKEGKLKIRARDRRTGASREFTLEEAEAWLAELNEKKGRNLNGYA
jgi:hypothetical protein